MSDLKRHLTRPKTARSTTLTAKERIEIIHRCLKEARINCAQARTPAVRDTKKWRICISNVDRFGKLQTNLSISCSELSGLERAYNLSVCRYWNLEPPGIECHSAHRKSSGSGWSPEDISSATPAAKFARQDKLYQTDNDLEFQNAFHMTISLQN